MRGGWFTYTVLLDNIDAYAGRHPGLYRASVAALPWLSFDEIVRIAHSAGLLPHSQVRQSTAERIRAVGFNVILTNPRTAHADLVFGSRPSPIDYDQLLSAFGGLVNNPALRVEL